LILRLDSTEERGEEGEVGEVGEYQCNAMHCGPFLAMIWTKRESEERFG